MKKVGIILSALFIATIALTSCEPDETCSNCRMVTEDAQGNIINESAATEYCGAELTTIENTPPQTIGGNTTYYVCD